MKKLLILAILVALGFVAAKRLRSFLSNPGRRAHRAPSATARAGHSRRAGLRAASVGLALRPPGQPPGHQRAHDAAAVCRPRPRSSPGWAR